MRACSCGTAACALATWLALLPVLFAGMRLGHAMLAGCVPIIVQVQCPKSVRS